MSGTPALFLDRDGVINQELGFLSRPDQVVWMDGIFELCATARDIGYKLVVVTNQSGIGRNLYTEAEFQSLMAWMRSEFAARNVPLDAAYHCPYHPVHGLGEYQREHPDRKPGPGMLLRAAHDLGLDLSRSVLIGDRCSDIAAANAAGLRQAYLLAGTEAGPCPGTYHPAESLSQIQANLNLHPTAAVVSASKL
jgi:D-glycero-D-manno-heptose 1,7-bisphosphate phosphatase